MTQKKYDAIIIGAGPNGLSAGITLVLQGLSVLIIEEKDRIGGGCKSEALTLPGFVHDVCSSIYPLAIGSPFFNQIPLSDYGLEWIHPTAPLAHPFDDGTSILLWQSLAKTCSMLNNDSASYHQLFSPIVNNWHQLESTILAPLRFPKHPFLALRFALKALRSAECLAKKSFVDTKTQALFAGLAAHSILPLDRALTAGVGLLLGAAGHVFGWPMPKKGAESLSNALGLYFQDLGGEIQTNDSVSSLDHLPDSRVILFDLTPKQIVKIAGDHLGSSYQRQLNRYRYGPGVYKMDWALSHPIPWKSSDCLHAGTVHIGGAFDEIAASEKEVWEGKHPEHPYVILAQHSLFDPTRAPNGMHTAWAYCHVPNGSTVEMADKIETQIERFAPGFKDCILARSTKNTREMTQYNSNYIGGDIIGGVQDIWQLFTRPTKRFTPYATSNPQIFICSSSTPPGGGVHGMCGYYAAKAVLAKKFGKK